MNIIREIKKQKAIELMQKLGIYKPYIQGFEKEDKVCFFECYVGFWADQEPELDKKIKEFEEQHDCLVYAVTHEYREFGECYNFLYVPDYKEEWDDTLIDIDANKFYMRAYVWNKTDNDCSKFSSIGVQSFGGGIRRL